MIKDIAYRVGRIEGDLGEIGQKFLVTLDRTENERTLVYYAHVFEYDGIERETPRHTEIARNFGLTNVLGGGILDFCPENLTLRSGDKRTIVICGISQTFGGVPYEVMQGFVPLLLPVYQKIDARVRGFDNCCHDVQISEVWREFGFEPNYDHEKVRQR